MGDDDELNVYYGLFSLVNALVGFIILEFKNSSISVLVPSIEIDLLLVYPTTFYLFTWLRN